MERTIETGNGSGREGGGWDNAETKINIFMNNEKAGDRTMHKTR